MPKRLVLGLPVTVAQAVQVFGSELRVAIVHSLAREPDRRQTDVALELNVDRSLVSYNVRPLVDLGVLIAKPSLDGRSQVFSVDHDRYDELLQALAEYGRPPADGDG